MRTKTRLAAVAVTVATSLAVAVEGSMPAQAAPGDGTYYSVNDHNPYGPMVIDIRQGSHDNRAQAILYAWHGGDNQRWTKQWFNNGDGKAGWVFVNTASGKCLDKSLDAPDADGNTVYQYDCHFGPNQRWTQVLSGGSRWGKLVNQSDGRCLDVDGPNDRNGAVLHVWHCYPTWSQEWNIDD